MEILNLDPRKKANEGTFLHLKHPGTGAYLYGQTDGKDDESKPVGLYLLGTDSDAFAKRQHEKVNARFTAKKPPVVTSESLERERVELVADLTVGWLNLEVDGSDEFTQANVFKLYSRLPWVREQADEWAGNRVNFI